MLAPSLKQPNLSARIGVKSLLGGAGAKFEATKPVSQDCGKVVVGRCCAKFEKQPNLSARIGVKPSLKQPSLSARIGVKSLLGGVGAKFEATAPVSQDCGKVVVGRCWRQV